jgi:hypothetical protein
MERIEALVNRLKQQLDANTDPSILLGTVQLLQFELTKMNTAEKSGLGTSKVAVVLPVAQVSVTAPSMNYDKYAPRPAETVQETNEEKMIYKLDPSPEDTEDEMPVTEEKETLLVDEGSVSVVQKNGQLDMVFDPLTEIPTLATQTREKEVNDRGTIKESLNDKLKQGKTELIEVLKETPVRDLRKAIGINDRFLYINELFRGDENMYERCIKTINSFNIYAEAEYWITRELKVKLGWKDDEHAVQQFYQMVKRRFS